MPSHDDAPTPQAQASISTGTEAFTLEQHAVDRQGFDQLAPPKNTAAPQLLMLVDPAAGYGVCDANGRCS